MWKFKSIHCASEGGTRIAHRAGQNVARAALMSERAHTHLPELFICEKCTPHSVGFFTPLVGTQPDEASSLSTSIDSIEAAGS